MVHVHACLDHPSRVIAPIHLSVFVAFFFLLDLLPAPRKRKISPNGLLRSSSRPLPRLAQHHVHESAFHEHERTSRQRMGNHPRHAPRIPFSRLLMQQQRPSCGFRGKTSKVKPARSSARPHAPKTPIPPPCDMFKPSAPVTTPRPLIAPQMGICTDRARLANLNLIIAMPPASARG